MHLFLITLMFLAAVPPDPEVPPLAGKVPAEGRWFASRTAHGTLWGPNVFTITHLTPRGLDTVFIATGQVPSQYVWADADTLVALDGFEPPLDLHWFDAGQVAQHVHVPATAWSADLRIFFPELAVLADGSAVLSMCALPGRTDASPCKRHEVLTIGRDGTITRANKFPRDVRRPSTQGLTPKTVRAPAGYKASLTKLEINGQRIKGVTCTSASATASWPTPETINWEFAIRPSKVVWVDDDPPIFKITGAGYSPIEERYTDSQFFLACTYTPIDSYRVLGDGLWLSGEDVLVDQVVATTYWTLWSNSQAIGRIQGDASGVLMAPY